MVTKMKDLLADVAGVKPLVHDVMISAMIINETVSLDPMLVKSLKKRLNI